MLQTLQDCKHLAKSKVVPPNPEKSASSYIEVLHPKGSTCFGIVANNSKQPEKFTQRTKYVFPRQCPIVNQQFKFYVDLPDFQAGIYFFFIWYGRLLGLESIVAVDPRINIPQSSIDCCLRLLTLGCYPYYQQLWPPSLTKRWI